jgi:hypothetical protein
MKSRGRKPGSALYANAKRKRKHKQIITRAHIERTKTAAARARTPSEVGAPRLFPDASKINFWVAEIDYQGKTLRIGSFSPKEHAVKMAERWRSKLALDDEPKKRRMPTAQGSADKLGSLERFK